MPRKYNHKQKIINRQPAHIKSVMPGMVLEFNYTGKNIFDKQPIILVLYNDYYGKRQRGKNVLIHSINLNYLNNASVPKFIKQLSTKGTTKEEIEVGIKDPEDEQEARSNRGLLREPYTQISLPNFKADFGEDRSLTRSEAKVQMSNIYKKLIKRYLVKKTDVYRTYKIKNMKNIRIVSFNFGI